MDNEDASIRAIDDIGSSRAQNAIPTTVPVATDHDEIRVQTITSCEYASPRLRRIAHGWFLDHNVRVTCSDRLQLPPCLFHQDCRKLVSRHAGRRRKLLWNRDGTVQVNPAIAPTRNLSSRAQNADRALGSVYRGQDDRKHRHIGCWVAHVSRILPSSIGRANELVPAPVVGAVDLPTSLQQRNNTSKPNVDFLGQFTDRRVGNRSRGKSGIDRGNLGLAVIAFPDHDVAGQHDSRHQVR